MSPSPSRSPVYAPVVSRSLLTAMLASLLAAGCGGGPKDHRPRVPVTVATVSERDMPYELIATGTIEAIESAAVGSNVGGVVTRVAFQEGSHVRAGDVLFELDPRPFRAALAQARAAFARDHAQAVAARLDAERARQLYAQQLTSQADFDQRTATAEALTAAAAADSAAMEAARLNLQYASISAPISGRTGRRLVNVGDYVKAATSDPLVTINRTDPVLVRFSIPQDEVAALQAHRARAFVLVRGADDDSTGQRGRLVFVDNAVDPQSGTLTLKGQLDNPRERWMPGQFVDVRLVLYTEPKAIVVPSPAVTLGQQGAYVYVMGADSTVSPRPVEVERSADETTIVSKGLAAGEIVITDGQLRLSPGARVLVRSAPKAQP